MKIMIDIGHPGHVHFFKNFIWEMKGGGHKFLITARDKECALQLLDAYGFEYVNRGMGSGNIIGKAWNMLKTDAKLWKLANKFKPDLFLSLGSMYAAHVSKLIGKPHITFDDTEHSKKQYILYAPFTEVICTPSCFKKNLGKKQIRYNGYHELAYLHPKYFKPNPNVLKEAGLKKGEKFFIWRFVSWEASHDMGQNGFDLKSKKKLFKLLKKYGKVIITSESSLSKGFEKYRMNISPEKIHDLLYYSTLYIGEGGTMATEAAVLGIPSIFVSSLVGTMGNFIELEEKYGLLYSFKSLDKALEKIDILLKKENLKEEFMKKRDLMLNDKMDVTKWMVRFIENVL